MDRSRKSMIASAARSREREGGGEEWLDKREKASKKGGRTHAHSNITLLWQRGMERIGEGEGAWGL